jgi:hypothetical protein
LGCSCWYLNVDYAFASAIARELEIGTPHIVVTYDIACQWGRHLRDCLSKYAATEDLNFDSLRSLRYVVPKFHLIGHGTPCHLNYNLAFMRGVGMTHGETVETIWSHSTSLATWSCENGPSACHALLDVHWSGWNWRKLVHLRMYTSLFSFSSFPLILSLFVGRQLKKNLEKAWKFSKIQGNIATTLTKALDPTLIDIWIEEMDAYYLDPLNEPNPFEEHVPSKPHFLRVHVPRVEY